MADDGRKDCRPGHVHGFVRGDDARLPYELSLYTPNSLGVSRSTAFWRDKGDDALVLAINRPEQWQTSQRYTWRSGNKPENLRFYDAQDGRYMQTQLAGRQRHWAIGAIPREELVVATVGEDPQRWRVERDFHSAPNRMQGAGPDVRLWQRLTDFSLDRYKDLVIDFDEPLTPFDEDAEPITFEAYWENGTYGGRGWSGLLDHLVQHYWDMSSGLGHYFGGMSHQAWWSYANSRAHWSEAQRRQARATLVFTVAMADSDNFMPHHSMLAGHPNCRCSKAAASRSTGSVCAARGATSAPARYWTRRGR